jgi:hypothetical protein
MAPGKHGSPLPLCGLCVSLHGGYGEANAAADESGARNFRQAVLQDVAAVNTTNTSSSVSVYLFLGQAADGRHC